MYEFCCFSMMPLIKDTIRNLSLGTTVMISLLCPVFRQNLIPLPYEESLCGIRKHHVGVGCCRNIRSVVTHHAFFAVVRMAILQGVAEALRLANGTPYAWHVYPQL